APVAERIRHPSSKRDDAGENPAGSTTFPDDVRAACPSVKRVVVVRVPVGEPFHSTERVRSVEDTDLKSVAPAMVSKVRVLGAPPFSKRPHGAIAARLVLNQETPEHYRVRVPLSFAR